MVFTTGKPRAKGAGRKEGTPNKSTELLKQGVKSAVEVIREGGLPPLQIMVECSRFLRSVAVAFTPEIPENATPKQQREILRNIPRADLDLIRRFMETSTNIAYKAAEFGYPKLARIDYAGDVPSGPTIENKMVFTLNIDQGQAPGRPVVIEEAAVVTEEAWNDDAPPSAAGEPALEDEWADEEE